MRPLLPLALGLLAACAHEAPPLSGPSHFDEPFLTGEPLRLTYDGGADRTPTWSTDPGRFMYAFDQGKDLNGVTTGCVSDLPVSGGSRGAEMCEDDPSLGDIQMRPYWPARRRDGSVAYVRQFWVGPSLNPYGSDLVVRSSAAGAAPRSIFPIPYFVTSTNRTHSGISHLQWLDATHLLYLGRVQVNGSLERVNSGIEIVILDPDSGMAGIAVVPGTHYASSVARGATSDTIYYTLGGDSLVYRRVLSTGVVDTAFDFGPLGIARDVQVRAGKVVAVVGGNVSFHSNASYGMVQDDFGGRIYAATLPAGVPVAITDTAGVWQHLALAPDGTHVVGESGGDLWSVAVP